MPNLPNFPMPLLTAAAIAGTVAFFAFPVLMAVLVVFLIRANRRASRAMPPSRLPLWLLSTGSAGLVLLVVGSFASLAAALWVSVGLLGTSLVLCGLFLRRRQERPLQGITWALFADLLVLVVFLPFGIWIAVLTAHAAAYNNPNETEVRAALARNPDDAAAHSSLAQIDMLRHDYAGEMREWRQVLRVEPDNEDALLMLGGRLSQTGRVEEARPLYARLAARNGPYSVNARKWLARHGGR